MIVLDTNVLSELINPEGDQRIRDWVNRVRPNLLFVTAINQAEILFGLARMPAGRKRDSRLAAADAMFGVDFRDRILLFDSAAAVLYADIAALRQRSGRRIDGFDGQIAAITRSQSMSLATRNVSHFVDCGVQVINPWSEE